MTAAVVATYNDVTTVKNVEDDLRSTGIPMEEIRVDNDHFKVRVTIPDVTKAEVVEILERHNPVEVH
jgi:hypothetical protein